jgi:protein O-mannosyl-transferase
MKSALETDSGKRFSPDSNSRSAPADLEWLIRAGLGAAIIAFLVLVVYSPASRFDFVHFDDPEHVYAHPRVSTGLSLENAFWAFSTLHGGVTYWHPLTWLSHQLDVQLFGLNPGPHHLVNVMLHSANSALVFLIVLTLVRDFPSAVAVAGLFAFHPIQVESVAWIAERKGVLCAFFSLLTILAYLRYVSRPALLRYSLVVFLFLCALMSKPMAVTLPLMLLLFDQWPLHRSGPDIFQIPPFVPNRFRSFLGFLRTIQAPALRLDVPAPDARCHAASASAAKPERSRHPPQLQGSGAFLP